MIVGEGKPPLNELAHYGVKGMRWGVRRTEQQLNAGYSDRMRTEDRRIHGKRAVARINSRLNAGETREKALEREEIRNARQRLAVFGGAIALQLIAKHGLTSMGDISSSGSKATAVGSTAAKLKYIKPNRSGVHKITTMK